MAQTVSNAQHSNFSVEPSVKRLEPKIESINIGLASPIRIRKWAERVLPNGEKVGQVLYSKTINYKTLKPEKDGLFCEKIFGPVNDFECSCEIKNITCKAGNNFCLNCGVEFTASRVRRYRLGYIKLSSPVSHVWYLRGRPRFLNILFDNVIAIYKKKKSAVNQTRKDIKPFIYGFNGIYIPLLKLIKSKPDSLKFPLLKKKNSLKKNQILSDSITDKDLLFLIHKKYFTEKLNKNCFHTIFKQNQVREANMLKDSFFLKEENKNFKISSLNDFFFTANEKKIFKKQLTKIISNSYFRNYNNYVLCLVANLSSRQKVVCIKQTSTTILLPDIIKVHYKNLFKKSSKQKNKTAKNTKNSQNSNIYLFNKKVFLNTNVIKIKNKAIFSSFSNSLEAASENSEASFNNKNFKINSINFPSILMPEIALKNNYSTKHLKKLFNKTILKSKLFSTSTKQQFYSVSKDEIAKQSTQKKKIVINFSTGQLNLPANRLDQETYFLLTSFQSQLDCYYPIFSKFLVKNINDDDEDKPEFKEFWNLFQVYMTPIVSKKDTILPSYFNRLENRYILIDNCTYKYTKTLLTGTEAISYWLKTLNLSALENQNKIKLQDIDEVIKWFNSLPSLYEFQEKILKKIIKMRHKLVRFMKLIYFLKKNKLRPEWLMISILPVLPPGLRPIIQLDANLMAVSDLNQLYKRVLYRNNRVEKYLKKEKTKDSNIIRFHQRLLQESVDALLDNGKGGAKVACSPNGRPFKSLSEILKGKKGRFRQNLLGKRVDYSGRSVIIVGPTLKLHQCGLPKEMALELFQTFILRNLRKLPSIEKIDEKITMIQAKKLIKIQHPIIWEVLKKLLKTHPILLNRAPTLHRLGIQAFEPILVENRAILLHPLVCPAFNADFDGDQMAVHVPLSFQARAEAWNLMWSKNNLLSPATGEPILIPSQDMVLGCYYLTTRNLLTEQRVLDNLWNNNITQLKLNSSNLLESSNFAFKQNTYFINLKDVLLAYNQKQISLHSFVWVKWNSIIEIENFFEKPIEIRVDYYGNVTKIYSKYFQILNNNNKNISQFMLTTVGRIIINTTILENIMF